MKIKILTIFPEMFDNFLSTSIIKRAIGMNIVEVTTHNIRDYTSDKYGRIDDYPCGGGAGLIMKVQPIEDCLNAVKTNKTKVFLMSPRGKVLTQKRVRELAKEEDIVLVCGHYEGIDERIMSLVDDSISIGDYVLTGGELAAQVVSDAIIRLQDGAIKEASHLDESFENGLLEYPQYTNPRVHNEQSVPDVLFTGNHKVINKWRMKESLRVTLKNRPDLLINYQFSKEELKLLEELKQSDENPKWLDKAIKDAYKFMKE